MDIDRDARTVTTNPGRMFRYGRPVPALGSRAYVPPIPATV
ncbi:MAG: hypothetical protein AB7O80_02715 [Acetobacteraceae bacterium]